MMRISEFLSLFVIVSVVFGVPVPSRIIISPRFTCCGGITQC